MRTVSMQLVASCLLIAIDAASRLDKFNLAGDICLLFGGSS